MSQKSKWEYLRATYTRYRKASKHLRALMLNESCRVCGYNRKYAIRLLNGPAPQNTPPNLQSKGDLCAERHREAAVPLLSMPQGSVVSVVSLSPRLIPSRSQSFKKLRDGTNPF